MIFQDDKFLEFGLQEAKLSTLNHLLLLMSLGWNWWQGEVTSCSCVVKNKLFKVVNTTLCKVVNILLVQQAQFGIEEGVNGRTTGVTPGVQTQKLPSYRDKKQNRIHDHNYTKKNIKSQ